MTTIKKRILAIDYGTKRIGLAKSDPLCLFAQPVGTFSESELYKQIQLILDQDGIEKKSWWAILPAAMVLLTE